MCELKLDPKKIAEAKRSHEEVKALFNGLEPKKRAAGKRAIKKVKGAE